MNQKLGNIGPYELRGELGRGAMARVWRAWDPNLEREVAIKVPLFDPNLPEGVLEEMGRRFVAEGRVAANLSHPGIVAVYAANVWDGIPAIVMELVDGATLSDLLSVGALPPKVALNILDQLLDALGYAHAHGVVHRDVKPDNIFVNKAGAVKLADFGIAHVDRGTMHATLAGTVLGTPGYMSPEQARGTEVDGRSDLFSVGVIAHEMLTGRNPFGAGLDADSTTLIYRIVHEPAPELPSSVAAGLPADMRPAIMAALSKNPSDRPATAGDFKMMLHGRVAPTAHTQVVEPADSWNSVRATPAETTPLVDQTYTTTATPSLDTSSSTTTPPVRRGLPSWLPYVAVAGVCTIAIVVALISAMGGSGGGSGSGGYSAYLSVDNGYVAIYTSNSTDPYEVTDVAISQLSPTDAAALGGRISVSSIDEAHNLVEQYRQAAGAAEAAAAQEAEAAEEATREAEERALEEARLKAQQEAEQRAAQEQEQQTQQAESTVSISIVGADGTTRNETIRRDPATQRVIPDSNSRLLSESEVDALTDAERCIAWNEIIAASNGYAFKNSGLANYFAGCSWYSRNPSADGGGNLSSNASKNVGLLQSRTSEWWKHLATN